MALVKGRVHCIVGYLLALLVYFEEVILMKRLLSYERGMNDDFIQLSLFPKKLHSINFLTLKKWTLE